MKSSKNAGASKPAIEEILSRGVADVIDRDHLKKALKGRKKLRLKLGIDPTGPNLHIGHAVVLWKLRALQDLGHRAIIVVGDFTALIGDPSGHDKMREVLTPAEIKENLKTFKKQALMVLDTKRTEFAPQTGWFGKMTSEEILGLTRYFSVWRLLERDLYKRRKKANGELSLLEFLYPVFQAYDSVAIRADVEFGGTDQTFNLLQGRRIQPHFGQEPQDIFTVELIEGLDGRKMSKTYGNTVNLLDSPNEKYGKVMSLRDELIVKYFMLCTGVSLAEIRAIESDMKSKKLNPRDAKARLAYEIVKLYHGENEAKKAEEEFNKVFQRKERPTKIKTIAFKKHDTDIVGVLIAAEFVSSKNGAHRLIKQGGVRVNGKKITEPKTLVEDGDVVQSGKRHFVRVSI